ncbi:hypothetical protein CCACVL1_20651 [Corchorus capsularis]|uniref:Uncharacterized protein n=1 Tax=Corchorus capsularis TaxID=210143 RepID=A0A1R3HAJ4_COCAP|nr:hypothetical protein CCACVL1_20651 [Corchorus capsularis]
MEKEDRLRNWEALIRPHRTAIAISRFQTNSKRDFNLIMTSNQIPPPPQCGAFRLSTPV